MPHDVSNFYGQNRDNGTDSVLSYPHRDDHTTYGDEKDGVPSIRSRFLSADMMDDHVDTFGFSNSQQEHADKVSQEQIDLERIETTDIKIDFPEGNKDSNSNFSENVTSEKNLYDLIGSV